MHPIILEASPTGLFRLILIIVLVYAIYRLFIQLVVPAAMRKYLKNFQERYTEQNKYTTNSQPQKKEGEISITYVDKDQKQTRNPDEGEYIDYEEIK